MNCSEVKYYLADYSKGLLLDEVRKEIHEHLNSCKNCAKVFDQTIAVNSKSGLKRAKVRHNKEVIEKIPIEGGKKRSIKNTVNKGFPVPSKSAEVSHLRNKLLLKTNEIENSKLFVIAGIISVIALGVIFALLVFDHSPNTFWSVEKISGYPVIESRILTDQGIIKVGEKLYTDSESRARLKVGTVGEIDVEPKSEISINETNSSEYKLLLSSGKISARTWSASKLFSITTPSATITDLGCMCYLSVDENGSTLLQVKSGWVLMENNYRKSLLPSGTSCSSDISKGLGTPFFNDASVKFKETLRMIDFENRITGDLPVLLYEARQKDLITLFHLLKRLDQESRGKIYDRISLLFKIPQRITREGIVNGDTDMMARLWTELDLGSISIYQNL